MLRLKRSRNDEGSSELKRALGGLQPPTIPGSMAAAIEQVSSPDCDLRDVAETIGRDPGLSARLLTIVNSAAYAPRNPIVGVTQAVTMFGKNQLESMLISLAASRVVASQPTPGFDLTQFWHVSAWRASAAAALSKHFDRAVVARTSPHLFSKASPFRSSSPANPATPLFWPTGRQEKES